MPTYIGLLNWTDQGARTVKDTIDRSEKAREIAKQVGAELKQVYWTMGPHDVVGLIEAPDDDTASAFSLALAPCARSMPTRCARFSTSCRRSSPDCCRAFAPQARVALLTRPPGVVAVKVL